MTQKGHGVIRGSRDLLYDPKGLWPLLSVWPSLWPQKVKGSWKVIVTYFMTPEVTVTFVVGLTYFMTPKVHGIMRGHGDLCGRNDLLYDLKRSRGHERSPWPTLWSQRSRWPLMSVWPSLWPQKVTGSLEVTVTYFMTQKVAGSLEVTVTYFMTPKGQGIMRGHLDLLYDPKGHGDLCGRFDLVYDPKMSRGH